MSNELPNKKQEQVGNIYLIRNKERGGERKKGRRENYRGGKRC